LNVGHLPHPFERFDVRLDDVLAVGHRGIQSGQWLGCVRELHGRMVACPGLY
jgi:hypothetical protein